MFSELWWMTNEVALRYLFSEKNKALWNKLWDIIGARAFTAGYVKSHVKFGLPGEAPKYEDIKSLRNPDAKSYFENRGLEFINDLTETDMTRLRAALASGKGLGEKKFAKIYAKDFSFSPERLKLIYTNEVHIGNRVAQTDAAMKAGKSTKTWIALGDEVTCPICGKMNGQTVSINSSYSNGEMVAHAHPRCRCIDIYK
jgi:SPP1 gp7 family putative phage head morphogenesis protein